jgi:hypothetical protein
VAYGAGLGSADILDVDGGLGIVWFDESVRRWFVDGVKRFWISKIFKEGKG